jgi:hypothetical protein
MTAPTDIAVCVTCGKPAIGKCEGSPKAPGADAVRERIVAEIKQYITGEDADADVALYFTVHEWSEIVAALAAQPVVGDAEPTDEQVEAGCRAYRPALFSVLRDVAHKEASPHSVEVEQAFARKTVKAILSAALLSRQSVQGEEDSRGDSGALRSPTVTDGEK